MDDRLRCGGLCGAGLFIGDGQGDRDGGRDWLGGLYGADGSESPGEYDLRCIRRLHQTLASGNEISEELLVGMRQRVPHYADCDQ